MDQLETSVGREPAQSDASTPITPAGKPSMVRNTMPPDERAMLAISQVGEYWEWLFRLKANWGYPTTIAA